MVTFKFPRQVDVFRFSWYIIVVLAQWKSLVGREEDLRSFELAPSVLAERSLPVDGVDISTGSDENNLAAGIPLNTIS